MNERYQRQIILNGFGMEAQQRLLGARVLVVGAGGLGCPVLMYLAGAGVGRIGVIDHDVVSVSNLHRQPLFNMDEIGQYKASVAVEKMRLLNPDISINAFPFRLTNTVCAELFPEYDLVLDCTDNFATRYMVNDACVLLGKPLVTGAVSRYEGQVMVLNAGDPAKAVNYRDLFPEPVRDEEIQNCAEAGVLGTLPGVIGSIMAGEVIKLICGLGEPLAGRLLTYQMLGNHFYDVEIGRHPRNAQAPKDLQAFLAMDYPSACGISQAVTEIDARQFDEMIGDHITVIDVREQGELPAVTEFEHLRWPLSRFDQVRELDGSVVFFCQSGIRSLRAAAQYGPFLQKGQQVYSLKGGIIAWKQLKKMQHV